MLFVSNVETKENKNNFPKLYTGGKYILFKKEEETNFHPTSKPKKII